MKIETSESTVAERVLGGCGALLTVLFAWIAVDSFAFDVVTVPNDPAALQQRPLLRVLSVFGIAFGVYFVTCLFVLRRRRLTRQHPEKHPSVLQPGGVFNVSRNLAIVIGFGLLFRLILLFSMPIQEVDIYRYILDGATSNAQVDPYLFAPQELLATFDKNDQTQHPTTPGEPFQRSDQQQVQLDKLSRYIADRPGLLTCVQEVHYGEFTSPYPPVGQFVFRVAMRLVPQVAGPRTWLRSMKAMLILFDIASGLLLIVLLRRCQLPTELSVLYWWCPLVLKEVANSGHLDSIAVFLTLAFAWFAVQFSDEFFRRFEKIDPGETGEWRRFGIGVAGSLALAFAVAAKVYPLVLAPLWAVLLIRQFRLRGVILLSLFAVVTLVCLWPQLRRTQVVQKSVLVDVFNDAGGEASAEEIETEVVSQRDLNLQRPLAGIEAFSRYWEMNDLLFMVIVENLKPDDSQTDDSQPATSDVSTTNSSRPWFRVTSNEWRKWLVSRYQPVAGIAETQVPFWLARRITLCVYGLLMIVLCIKSLGCRQPAEWLSICFYALAAFWMLAPTQNPWYWLWSMPLVAFVRRPLPWLLISGTLFLYYLRFWFEYHMANSNVAGTPYQGTLFFDFVMPWIEFGPIFAFLAFRAIWNWSRNIR